MHILVTNDDGIYSKGIKTIARELNKKHTVTVIAPDIQRSACGHAITMHIPLMIQKVDIEGLEGIDCYITNGTPADCVKLGVVQILQQIPDLVVSGINNGANAGSDILYSGTVSGALEGAILGIRSFALSIDHFMPKHLSDAAEFFCDFLEQYDIDRHDKDIVLNINFPDTPSSEFKGFVAVPQGITKYTEAFKERSHPRGYTYFWLSGKLEAPAENDPDTDIKLLKNGYIVITPLRYNLTDEKYLEILSEKIKNIHI